MLCSEALPFLDILKSIFFLFRGLIYSIYVISYIIYIYSCYAQYGYFCWQTVGTWPDHTPRSQNVTMCCWRYRYIGCGTVLGTTRIISFFVGVPINSDFPLLLGGGHTQQIYTWFFFMGEGTQSPIFKIGSCNCSLNGVPPMRRGKKT